MLSESFLRGRPSTVIRRNADAESNGMTFQILIMRTWHGLVGQLDCDGMSMLCMCTLEVARKLIAVLCRADLSAEFRVREATAAAFNDDCSTICVDISVVLRVCATVNGHVVVVI